MIRALALAFFVSLVSACASLATSDTPLPVTSDVFATVTPNVSQPGSELPPTVTPGPAPLTPMAAATRLPAPPPTPIIPISFSVTPTITQRLGDRLTMNWKAVGDEASICPMDGTGPLTNLCVKVPLAGSRTVTTDAAYMGYTGYMLRVSKDRVLQFSTVSVAFQCQGLRDWFFANPPRLCPAAVALTTDATAQQFEHGLMVWLAQSDTFYVFFEDGSAPRYVEFASHLSLKPGASPDNRVGGAPGGMHEPTNTFGMIWRGEIEGFANVRERLGWAADEEFNYDVAYQCATPSQPRSWSCYLRLPDSRVVRMHPDSTAQVRFLWEDW